MLDGAILAGGIHRLKDDQHGVTIGRVEQILQVAQLLDLIAQQRFALVLGPIEWFDARGPFVQFDPPAANPERFGIDFHGDALRCRRPAHPSRF